MKINILNELNYDIDYKLLDEWT